MATYSVTTTPEWEAGALVPTADVTTYATDRNWSDWLAATEAAQDAAVLDASTYVRAVWTPPVEYTEAKDDAIADAIAEASRLALSGALLGGSAAGADARLAVSAGSVSVTYAGRSAKALRGERMALVSAMLRSAGCTGGSTINFGLRKA